MDADLPRFSYRPSAAVQFAAAFLLGAACGATIGYFLGANLFAVKVNEVLDEPEPPWTADQVIPGIERTFLFKKTETKAAE